MKKMKIAGMFHQMDTQIHVVRLDTVRAMDNSVVSLKSALFKSGVEVLVTMTMNVINSRSRVATTLAI